jgi:DNA-binding IclR family transcriptional regulator
VAAARSTRKGHPLTATLPPRPNRVKSAVGRGHPSFESSSGCTAMVVAVDAARITFARSSLQNTTGTEPVTRSQWPREVARQLRASERQSPVVSSGFRR